MRVYASEQRSRRAAKTPVVQALPIRMARTTGDPDLESRKQEAGYRLSLCRVSFITHSIHRYSCHHITMLGLPPRGERDVDANETSMVESERQIP